MFHSEHLSPLYHIIRSYVMMMKCWQLAPDDRPSFKEIYKSTSTYIENMAGYLELGCNPFTGLSSIVEQPEEKEIESDDQA